jgi:hypothetical protein
MAALILGCSNALATSVETLLMPGKVTKAHVKQEENCANCHDRSNARTQTSLCLDCHKEIAADMPPPHGLSRPHANAGAGECRACHTEHKGRERRHRSAEADAQFDHRLTDFPLEGAHRGGGLRGLPQARARPGARRPRPVSAATRRTMCITVSSLNPAPSAMARSTWSGAKFDHDKTEFKLTGAHAAVSCDACHIAGRYKQTPKTCNGCHATDDEHRGRARTGLREMPCNEGMEDREVRPSQGDRLRSARGARPHHLRGVPPTQRQLQGQDPEGLQRLPQGGRRARTTLRRGKCGDCHDNERWPVNRLRSHAHAITSRWSVLTPRSIATRATPPPWRPRSSPRIARAAIAAKTLTAAS